MRGLHSRPAQPLVYADATPMTAGNYAESKSPAHQVVVNHAPQAGAAQVVLNLLGRAAGRHRNAQPQALRAADEVRHAYNASIEQEPKAQASRVERKAQAQP